MHSPIFEKVIRFRVSGFRPKNMQNRFGVLLPSRSLTPDTRVSVKKGTATPIQNKEMGIKIAISTFPLVSLRNLNSPRHPFFCQRAGIFYSSIVIAPFGQSFAAFRQHASRDRGIASSLTAALLLPSRKRNTSGHSITQRPTVLHFSSSTITFIINLKIK